MEQIDIQRAIEAILFAAGERIECSRLAMTLEVDEREVEEAVNALEEKDVRTESGNPIHYEGTVAYWKYKAEHPSEEDYYTQWFEAYYDKGAKKSGVNLDTYLSYRKKVKGMDSKKDILPIINGMNITKAQKDALYREHTTWSEDAISEAPWH